ncbi:MAG: hypothetical protein IKZ34_02035 [Alphaproteobacteria bacterium]|nr:hypothetical protein [Alphaproteobacteria bacterium]
MNAQIVAEQQKKLVIKIDKELQRAVDKATRSKLVDAYMKLFSGFAWVNWTKKQSLGRAWQNALGQCEGFLKTKNKTNPAAKYLNIVAKAHKKYWSEIIMTNKNSPNTLSKTPEEIKQLQQYGKKLIREAMDTINLIIARYNEHVEEITGVEKTAEKTVFRQATQQAAQPAQQPAQQVAQAAVQQAQPAQQMPQRVVMPAAQVAEKQVQQAQQIPQRIAMPAIQVAEKQVQQAQQMPQRVVMPAAQAAEKQAQQAQQMPQRVVAPQAQVTEKKVQQVKPIEKQTARPEVRVNIKTQQQAKPEAQKMPEKTQQTTSLKTGTDKQIVQQRINMFILAKYNQKVA